MKMAKAATAAVETVMKMVANAADVTAEVIMKMVANAADVTAEVIMKMVANAADAMAKAATAAANTIKMAKAVVRTRDQGGSYTSDTR